MSPLPSVAHHHGQTLAPRAPHRVAGCRAIVPCGSLGECELGGAARGAMVQAAGNARARGMQLGLDAVLLKGLQATSSQQRNDASGSVEEPPPLAWVDSITGDVLVGQNAAVSAERSRLNHRRAVEAPSSESLPALLAPPAVTAPTPVAGAHTPSTSLPGRSSLAARLSKRLLSSGAPPLAPAAQAERRAEPGKGKVPVRHEVVEHRAAAPRTTHNKASPGTFVEGSLVDQMQHLEREKPHGIKGVMYLMKLEM
jgi:hypothetical protein